MISLAEFLKSVGQEGKWRGHVNWVISPEFAAAKRKTPIALVFLKMNYCER